MRAIIKTADGLEVLTDVPDRLPIIRRAITRSLSSMGDYLAEIPDKAPTIRRAITRSLSSMGDYLAEIPDKAPTIGYRTYEIRGVYNNIAFYEEVVR